VLRDDILYTMGQIEQHAIELKADDALRYLRGELLRLGNDATWARQTYAREHLLAEVVRQQCLRWSGELVV
ncbi:hypothetical protein OFC49_40195, partial [Escherichia coli]|nr:hypothetical protein [Escherichia coli]